MRLWIQNLEAEGSDLLRKREVRPGLVEVSRSLEEVDGDMVVSDGRLLLHLEVVDRQTLGSRQGGGCCHHLDPTSWTDEMCNFAARTSLEPASIKPQIKPARWSRLPEARNP